MKTKPKNTKGKKIIGFNMLINNEESYYTGDIEATLDFIRSYLEEIEDGDSNDFDIKRVDMTKEEIEELPED